MKKITNISVLLLIFSGCSMIGYNRNEIDLKNISGAYSSEEKDQVVIQRYSGTSKSDLQLMADSSFSVFIQNSNSDFPTEFFGKWKLNKTAITLSDTTGKNNATIHLSVNENGSLTGKYADHNFVFNKCTK
jgi:hypothetical protein